MRQEILALVKVYLAETGDPPSDEFLLLLIDSVIEAYKNQRRYPEGTKAETIQTDMESYFNYRKNYVAMEVVPAMLGKVGGEGLYSLVDNQVSKNWKTPFPVYLPDVVPYCEVMN